MAKSNKRARKGGSGANSPPHIRTALFVASSVRLDRDEGKPVAGPSSLGLLLDVAAASLQQAAAATEATVSDLQGERAPEVAIDLTKTSGATAVSEPSSPNRETEPRTPMVPSARANQEDHSIPTGTTSAPKPGSVSDSRGGERTTETVEHGESRYPDTDEHGAIISPVYPTTSSGTEVSRVEPGGWREGMPREIGGVNIAPRPITRDDFPGRSTTLTMMKSAMRVPGRALRVVRRGMRDQNTSRELLWLYWTLRRRWRRWDYMLYK